MTTQTAVAERTLPDIFYEEPETIEDGMRQAPTILRLLPALKRWFKGRKVFVGADGFIFWNRANGNDRVAPDGMVALDTDSEFVYQFPNYFVWEVGKPPDLVMEVASPSTAGNDLGHKRDLYAWLKIPEYWKFDPTGGNLYGTPLLGERLVDGQYVPYELNEETDGSVWSRSEVLGLEFWWDGLDFDIRDPLTGQSIDVDAIADREIQARMEAEQRADMAERERDQADQRAESERTRADAADQRAERERQMRLDMEARLRDISERHGQDEGENLC